MNFFEKRSFESLKKRQNLHFQKVLEIERELHSLTIREQERVEEKRKRNYRFKYCGAVKNNKQICLLKLKSKYYWFCGIHEGRGFEHVLDTENVDEQRAMELLK